ncbi:unnamed protein product [Cyprideis torosa]|uniref:Intraflagellar transport protein 122 homolog n=1 Tax=Cyprideis torosa TaxID=163714 RepID=A0A7R8WCJ2_9CRUS|nr:unnamed protein product [Cyprideis torosa]CAG0893454.1 unnamed protein product [Cyprideis torosa]
MRAIPTWVDKVHDRDKTEQCIYDLCFRPDGSQLIVGAGSRVLVYDTTDGSLIQPLKGHKDSVLCVCYARDGKRFASGGADKQVIIWTSKLEGILKYSHNDAIQCMAYNPVSHQLASCAISDFGLWSAEQKNVNKTKVSSRINACAWTDDGLYLALGHSNGSISIRNKAGEEKNRIERPEGSHSPIHCLAWNPNRDDPHDILAVGDWGQTLSFYTLSGKPGRTESAPFIPEKEFVWGTLGRTTPGSGAVLQSLMGISWYALFRFFFLLCVEPLAVGCQDGTIAYYHLIFGTVHALYRERYSYRENMTDVIIQHLITGEKVRIRCRDLVKRIAIYKHRLAVQLPERVVVYELCSDETEDMRYKVKDRINKKLECNLLVICAKHLILCQERRLQSLSPNGQVEREWVVGAPIRYIKVVGGAPGREGMILGLKNGQVIKLFVDNPFPLPLLNAPSAIRCLDLSMSRQKLAVVDDTNTLLVYSLTSKELLYQEPNANSVAWNSQLDDLICFSGADVLTIKAADFPGHQQALSGFVVGFTGSRIFCLHLYTMESVEIPLSSPMYQFIERKKFDDAFSVACLGVTDGDWMTLAASAMEGLNLKVARKAMTRTKDLVRLELLDSVEERMQGETADANVFAGEILAYQGKFADAARSFVKAKRPDLALEMYTDLRMFDLAQEFAGAGGESRDLLRKKADWAKHVDPRAAAEMYLNAGETLRAIEIMGEKGWVEMLVETGRKLDKADVEALRACALHLRRLGQASFAVDLYRQLGELETVAAILVEEGQWDEAFLLCEKNPEFNPRVYVPYARFLAESDKFIEAQRAFHKAGRPDEAARVLGQLTLNAVEENRFRDAGYYYWVLSMQDLDLAAQEEEPRGRDQRMALFLEHQRKAEVYYTYHVIQRYTEEPFTSYSSEQLFNIARFLVHALMGFTAIKGVSRFYSLYALARQARNLGAFKTANYALNKIHSLRVPTNYQEAVAVATLGIRGKPFVDDEDLLPFCYRCSASNPLVNPRGDVCNNCGHAFIHSFSHFEVLPLVEFAADPAEGLSDVDTVRLIESAPSVRAGKSPLSRGPQWREETGSGGEVLRLEDDGDDDAMEGYTGGVALQRSPRRPKHSESPEAHNANPFGGKILGLEDGEPQPIVLLSRSALASLEPSEVIIAKWPQPVGNRYFKNLMPEMSLTLCPSCFRFFLTEDWELTVLQHGHCPFCRLKVGEDEPGSDDED